MKYNTQRSRLVIPEYGRHVQTMVEYTKKLESKEERNTAANAIITLMATINPHFKELEDYKHKLWDHLFIIADFDLDVDAPYPIPQREDVYKKPERIPYPRKNIKYKHYGYSIQKMIEKAVTQEEGPERDRFVEVIANLMKKAYLNYNRDSVNDELIKDHLIEMSGGLLKLNENQRLHSTNHILDKKSIKKKTFKPKNHTQTQGQNRPKRY